ncbi:MAG TPA: hypothetical protein VFN67_31315 [Polyangiales bacterium]|jgi:hypothetical protein|nr:hypothetical protein [Polyangiales bacterium]
MLYQATTTTTLSVTDRNELALIRNDLAKALRGAEPDTRTLQTIVQRLDTLLAPSRASAPARRTEVVERPVVRSLFAGW